MNVTGEEIVDYHRETADDTGNTKTMRCFGSGKSGSDDIADDIDDDVKGLINFVRGKDYFDYDGDCNITETRSKPMGDVYHSQLVTVGVPSAETAFTSTNQESYWRSHKGYVAWAKQLAKRKEVIYVGSKTGRDGIHGASMASAEFDKNAEEKKPTVQVGDPFTEKLLLEACLELMKDDSIISIQDMGAAGLTSSSVEMASKGNLGIELNLNKVPCREDKMTPYEIMLSESQERMLIVLESGKEAEAKKIFDKWNLDLSLIHI